MIFLRQKHFSNNGYRTRNLNRNNTRQQTNINTNNNNRTFNRYQTRPTTTSNSQISHANLIRLANPAFTTSSTNNYPLNSNNYIRSSTINERIASIGGLFGILSILITGALLYAIFTARNEDKQYYIIAVLVNVSILIFVMVSAILFDRFYLKKLTNQSIHSSTNNSNENIIRSSNNENNIMPNTISATYDYLNNQNFRVCNDVPPQYPGIIEQNELIQSTSSSINNDNNNNPTHIATTVTNTPILHSSIILVNPIKKSAINSFNTTKRKVSIDNRSSSSSITTSSYIPSSFNVYLDHKNEVVVDEKDKKTNNTNPNAKLNDSNNPPPPNYFDLYPLKENDENTQIILNQNLLSNASNSIAINNEERTHMPSTSSNSNVN